MSRNVSKFVQINQKYVITLKSRCGLVSVNIKLQKSI